MTTPRPRRRAAARLVVVLAVAGALGGGVLAARGSERPRPPAPGVSAGVSALTRLPVAAALPPAVARWIDSVAPLRATDPAQAKARARKLRSHLGKPGADLYAFRTSNGAPCFVLVRQVGLCPQSATDGSPGLQWTIGGGSPSVPSNLVGIASDEVADVALVVDGARVPVSLENNVVFGEYSAAAKQATITIDRRDGTQSSIRVALGGAPDLRDVRILRAAQLAQARR